MKGSTSSIFMLITLNTAYMVNWKEALGVGIKIYN